jgi:hypothetical protein
VDVEPSASQKAAEQEQIRKKFVRHVSVSPTFSKHEGTKGTKIPAVLAIPPTG